MDESGVSGVPDVSRDNQVRIFDTTLRDGEQSPGASLTSAEKIDIARQLARLGVDVIEAGFPAASPDDLEGVRRVAREVGTPDGPIICGLARATTERHRQGLGSGPGRRQTAHPHLSRHVGYSHAAQAAHDARAGRRAHARDGQLCALAVRGCRVFAGRRLPLRSRISWSKCWAWRLKRARRRSISPIRWVISRRRNTAR